MRISSRSMGLGAVLLLLLLLLLDSSCAQSVKRQKVTDPNYMHHVMNGGDASTSSYKHGYSSRSSAKLTAKASFIIESCTVKFPGIAENNILAPVAGKSRPNAVSFWWRFGCTAGGTTHSDVGSCFGEGTTDNGIAYSDSTASTNSASVTFTCKLDADKAEECNPKLKCLDDVQKLMVTGQGRLAFTFTAITTAGGVVTTPSSFSISNPDTTTNQNEQPHLAVTSVPLTRYTQGFAVLDVSGCTNGNAKGTTPELTLLPQTSPLPTGANSKFQLMLAP